MSDSKEKEEGGQNAPLAVHKTQQSVDAQVQPEALAAPQPIEEKMNDVENRKVEAEAPAGDKTGKVEVEAPMEEQNGKVEVEAASEDKNGKVEVEAPVEDKNGKVQVEAPVEDKNGKVQVEAPSADKNEEALVEAPMVDKNVKPEANLEGVPRQDVENSENSTLHSVLVEDNAQALKKTEYECVSDFKSEAEEVPQSDRVIENDASVCQNNVDTAETALEMKPESCEAADSRACNDGDSVPLIQNEPITPSDRKVEIKNGLEIENKDNETQAAVAPADNGNSISKNFCFLDADHSYDGNESGTDEEQSAFMKELENFFRERSMEFKPPKFYGEGLNCLKLWRAVIRLGGYDKVTTCKLWRQVGESFKPPKTCTTVSWTFRGFYEKALLDYERHKTQSGELNVPIASHSEPMNIENQSLLPDKCVQASASGRARRDAAAKAMQGWHSQRLLGNGEVSDPVIKDRNSLSMQKREKQLKSINLLKRKKPSYMDNTVKAARSKPSRPQLDTSVIDIGPPADWVKINVQKTKDCFEVYALVPGLLREEVRVQSDPAGRLVISGEPEHPDNPWGVTPFKKVVSLPSRIDPHQTSAVVTLHGQLFVRVPFEQSE